MLLPISMPENRQLLWHGNLLSWNWIVMAVLLFCLSPAVSVQNNLCLECAETTNPFCYFYAIRISIVATITLFCNSCRSRVQLPLMRLCGEEQLMASTKQSKATRALNCCLYRCTAVPATDRLFEQRLPLRPRGLGTGIHGKRLLFSFSSSLSKLGWVPLSLYTFTSSRSTSIICSWVIVNVEYFMNK